MTPKTPFHSHRLSLPLWLALALLVLLAIVAYHNCLPNEMFWDDDDFILKNRYIKNFAYWPLWFKENLVAGAYLVSNYWRPLLLWVFAIEWHWWANWTYGWHIVSVSFHLLDSVLLFFLTARLFDNRLLGWLVAAIFLVHPAHNEAVVYVNSLGDSLSALFVLSGLLLFTRYRHSGKKSFLSRNYYFSLLCFPLAVLSKETGFVLAALMPALDFILLQANKPLGQRVRTVLSACWPILTMAFIYIILRGTVLNFANSFNFYNETNEFTSNPLLRLMTFFKAITQYAGFLFIPYQLRVERTMPWAHSLWEWDVLWGGLIVAGMIIAIFRTWKTRPWIAFGFTWFFLAIAPASNIIIPINAVLYEHFLYMPMVGIWIVVLGLLLKFTEGTKQKYFLVGFVVVLGIFCAINIRRNLDWRTAIGFYEHIAQYSSNYRVINNLGMEYADKGIHDKAETTYLKAIAMDPKNPVAYHNIAGTYRDTGRTQLALDNFHKALELNPNFIFSYRSLAELYWRLQDWPACRLNLIRILQIDPTDINVQNALKDIESKIASTPL